MTCLAILDAAAAAQFDDPDWPCVQRKVPEISIGQMWPGPIPEGEPDDTDAIERLGQQLAARRVTIDEAEAAAAAFVDGVEGEDRANRLALLFAAALDRINAERGQLIAGIGRYAHGQTMLAERVEERQLDLVALSEVPEDRKDWDRIEELQDTLAWDTRIYKERAQALTYVCETPVLLERRAFELARALAGLI